MVDHVSRNVRSAIMRSVTGVNTRPELQVRSQLHRLGFRFRLHDHTLPGRPDLVMKSHQAVVFVHGCFWHGHSGCRFAGLPKSNTTFWREKQTANRARDARVERKLRQLGWRVHVVWSCELKDPTGRVRRLHRLASRILAAKSHSR